MLVAIAGYSASAQGPLGDDFTYQGQLINAGVPAVGNYDFRFRLYDSPAAGLQIGPALNASLPVDSQGRFSVALDFPGASSFTGSERFLEIDVSPAGAGAWVTLTPRQKLRASPHAAYSLAAGSAATATNAVNATTAANALALNSQAGSFYQNAGNLNAGTVSSARISGNYSNALTMTNAANVFGGNGSALTGLNASNIASGVINDARLSSNVALLDTAQIFTATKTFSNGTLPLSIQDGVAGGYGISITNQGGSALYVDNTAAGLVGYGVNATVDGTSTKYGFLATITGASGTGYGLYVNNTSPGGRGVFAITSGTGSNYGFYNSNAGDTGRAFYGILSGVGANYGVYISNSSPLGYGGYFNNTATTGTTYGLYCENNSADGYGLFARHDASTGTGPAIYGTTDSTSSSANAIHGVVASTSPGALSAAIRGENRGTGGSGIGVYGSHAGTGWGGYFTSVGGYGVYATSTDFYAVRGISTNSYGVYGSSTGSYGVRGISTDNYGVYGSSTNDFGVYGYSTNSYGGYFDTGVTNGPALYVVGTASVGVITIRGGADLAEDFEVVNEPETIEPGMVVMIDPDHVGGVMLASGAYNKCVAGVVSGANELAAGMVLGRFEGQENGKPIALSGRVWTYVDASEAAVQPGDLLTTSDVAGYAMPVTDHTRAHGATIGKAMSRLEKGEKGLVLVLVNLQ